MSSLVIRGGKELNGVIEVGGSKNAALPIIFATVIARGKSVLHGVPDISDVKVALSIIEEMGASVIRSGSTITVDTENMSYRIPSPDTISSIRASSYLIGACLSRFGVAHVLSYGGCNFSGRPVDMHISAACSVGASLAGNELSADSLHGADIVFNKISVGATVNALLLTAAAHGHSRIFGYAREPHIYSLCAFLRTAGASIEFFDSYIDVVGTSLHGGEATIIPDMIEAGTYVALSLATSSSIKVVGSCRDDLTPLWHSLATCGACISFDGDAVTADGRLDECMEIVTAPHPSFPTDLQPQMAPLMARFSGGVITEGVWESRFGYLSQLSAFGAEYEQYGNRAIIKPSHIVPARVEAPDLRGGAALLIAALIADGESEILSSEIIGRGYENIVKKLRSVGAVIEERN